MEFFFCLMHGSPNWAVQGMPNPIDGQPVWFKYSIWNANKNSQQEGNTRGERRGEGR